MFRLSGRMFEFRPSAAVEKIYLLFFPTFFKENFYVPKYTKTIFPVIPERIACYHCQNNCRNISTNNDMSKSFGLSKSFVHAMIMFLSQKYSIV